MNSILRDKFLQHAPNSMLALVESVKEMNECGINVKDVPKRSVLACEILDITNVNTLISNTKEVASNLHHVITIPTTNTNCCCSNSADEKCACNGHHTTTTISNMPNNHCTSSNYQNGSCNLSSPTSPFGACFTSKFTLQKKRIPKRSSPPTIQSSSTATCSSTNMPFTSYYNSGAVYFDQPTTQISEQNLKRKHSNVNVMQHETLIPRTCKFHAIGSPQSPSTCSSSNTNNTFEYNNQQQQQQHDSKKRKIVDTSFHLSTQYSTTAHSSSYVLVPNSSPPPPVYYPSPPNTPNTPPPPPTNSFSSFNTCLSLPSPTLSPCKLPPIRDLLNSLQYPSSI
ncbi:predicted protein [Naegleria gruberi]|uniref:Predicted protein n=1 Tax=Naegleria gruberi TaxID=5762 RepID=D2V6R9_NAEGR|nr:uncharacterized protein NAEGRDRAFT_64537 [Naegleria gruberi]EFC47489.1 predicted protein [Naegleria gruberi]|eukprot:XP_002680233.1 predicted protein [Naegleria gruberi strain NEG-M]